jgi:hypothetical protein
MTDKPTPAEERTTFALQGFVTYRTGLRLTVLQQLGASRGSGARPNRVRLQATESCDLMYFVGP